MKTLETNPVVSWSEKWKTKDQKSGDKFWMNTFNTQAFPFVPSPIITYDISSHSQRDLKLNTLRVAVTNVPAAGALQMGTNFNILAFTPLFIRTLIVDTDPSVAGAVRIPFIQTGEVKDLNMLVLLDPLNRFYLNIEFFGNSFAVAPGAGDTVSIFTLAEFQNI